MLCPVSSRLRWVTLLSLLAATGCVSTTRAARVHDDTPLTVLVAPAAGAPRAVATTVTATPAPAISFETLLAELDEVCPDTAPAEETTLGMKEAQGAHVACVKREADSARDALLASFKKDDARITRVEAAEAAYAQLADDICWASEEVQWVDFAEGTRDDGSLRDFAWLACQSRVQVERVYLLRSMSAKDAHAFAEHLDEVAPRGTREAVFLSELHAKAKVLAAKPMPKHASPAAGSYPGTLGLEARNAYAVRFAAIERQAGELGRATCAAFDGLPAESGGEPQCERKTKRGLLALGAFEASGEDAGP
jgi:hypothetical protein